MRREKRKENGMTYDVLLPLLSKHHILCLISHCGEEKGKERKEATKG